MRILTGDIFGRFAPHPRAYEMSQWGLVLKTKETLKMSEFAHAKKKLKVGDKEYSYFDINSVREFGDVSKLPGSIKVLLENLLRHSNHGSVDDSQIKRVASWATLKNKGEIPYFPSRVLMQDFTGVPAVVDLAAMREGVKSLGGDPQVINPQVPVDLVIDHSVMVDAYGTDAAFGQNVGREFERNNERYEFLKWGQSTFDNFKVVPPGTGICHQVNIEYLASVVGSKQSGNEHVVFPDTLVGTDSHTTMVNALAVLGWGVGGIEAEAAMLGQPIAILVPEVVGFELKGELAVGSTATDLVLKVVQMLRSHGVVGKFVEFYGEGLNSLTLADRATISNMAPEYGATCGYFPIDNETIKYLNLTARSTEQVQLVEAYAKAQGLWREDKQELTFTESLSLNMGEVKPAISGPKRPQDRIDLDQAKTTFEKLKTTEFKNGAMKSVAVEGENYELKTGAVVIAAITSCTNTSNPAVMIGAGLVAQKARAKGLQVKPWVKTSLAPGSQVVTDYLVNSGLQDDLNALGYQLVGYGCTTCIGNSGPLKPPIEKAIIDNELLVCSVLSGNRNFEGRISPIIQANFLASPPLVVGYALAGRLDIDFETEALGKDKEGKEVFLKDVWPSTQEIEAIINSAVKPELFETRYKNVFEGPQEWKSIKVESTPTYSWNAESTYIQNPPFFEGIKAEPQAPGNIKGARILALLGDSVTTDHISPAGSIGEKSPAGQYLSVKGVSKREFNSFGSRRGNHEVMMRGTFGNVRIKNEMLDGVIGGWTKYLPTGETESIYDASMKYQKSGTPLVVIAGKEYGTGSSRDWAAKGTGLLGVKAVIAESFERIHRSNLVGMGVLPLEFPAGVSKASLKLDGSESISVEGLTELSPGGEAQVTVEKSDGTQESFTAAMRLDTQDDVESYTHGGILQATLRRLIKE